MTAFHEAASSVNRKCHFWYGFLLLRLHICSFARDAAAVQTARGLRAVRVALTGVAFRAI